MLKPRGRSGLEAKILVSVSASASKLWPRHRPRLLRFGLGLGFSLKHLASVWPQSGCTGRVKT